MERESIQSDRTRYSQNFTRNNRIKKECQKMTLFLPKFLDVRHLNFSSFGLDLQGLSGPRAWALHKFYLNFTRDVLTLAKIYSRIGHTQSERKYLNENLF